MKLFLKIKFDGTAYAGYQAQSNADTVQGRLNAAARELFGADCDITGCSRTDAGVHALAFCATVAKKGKTGLDNPIPIEAVPAAFNAHLPDDIAVFYATDVRDDFHARYGVVGKTYEYKILNTRVRDPFSVNRTWHYPRPITDAGLEQMREAASHLIGRHDFTSFMASGSKITDACRNVTDIGIERDGEIVIIRISADGFLYNMVRIICGTLIEVVEDKIDAPDIPRIIAARDRSRAGRTLPACGLYLSDVRYGVPISTNNK